MAFVQTKIDAICQTVRARNAQCASRGEALESPTSDTDSNEEEEDKLLLDDWDEWMQDN